MPVATLTAIYVNAHLPKNSDPVSPSDFIPTSRQVKKESGGIDFNALRARFIAIDPRVVKPKA